MSEAFTEIESRSLQHPSLSLYLSLCADGDRNARSVRSKDEPLRSISDPPPSSKRGHLRQKQKLENPPKLKNCDRAANVCPSSREINISVEFHEPPFFFLVTENFSLLTFYTHAQYIFSLRSSKRGASRVASMTSRMYLSTHASLRAFFTHRETRFDLSPFLKLHTLLIQLKFNITVIRQR